MHSFLKPYLNGCHLHEIWKSQIEFKKFETAKQKPGQFYIGRK